MIDVIIWVVLLLVVYVYLVYIYKKIKRIKRMNSKIIILMGECAVGKDTVARLIEKKVIILLYLLQQDRLD